MMRTLNHATAKINLCFIRLLLKRLALNQISNGFYTLQNADEFIIDHRGRGTNSPVFSWATQRGATTADLTNVAIDNINPNISIAADLLLVKDEFRNTGLDGLSFANEVEFGVPENSRRAPLTIGANPWSIANASNRDWLQLVPVDGDDTTEDLTPTLSWTFDEDYEDVKEVNLFVSSSPENEGLLPWDRLANLKDPILPSYLS